MTASAARVASLEQQPHALTPKITRGCCHATGAASVAGLFCGRPAATSQGWALQCISCHARPPCAAGPHLLPRVVFSPPSPRPQKLSVGTQPTQRVLCRLPLFILPSYVAAVPRLWVSLLQVWCAAGRTVVLAEVLGAMDATSEPCFAVTLQQLAT
jgi:hypothetical protein